MGCGAAGQRAATETWIHWLKRSSYKYCPPLSPRPNCAKSARCVAVRRMPPSPPGARAPVPSTGHVDLRAPPPASPSRRPAAPGRSSSQGQRSSSVEGTASMPGFQQIRKNSHLRVEVEDSVPLVVGAGPSVLARKLVPGGPGTSPAERLPSSTSSKQRSPSPGNKKAGSPRRAGSPHRRRRSPSPSPTKLKSAAGSPSAHTHSFSSPTKVAGSGSPSRLERLLGSASVGPSLDPPEWTR